MATHLYRHQVLQFCSTGQSRHSAAICARIVSHPVPISAAAIDQCIESVIIHLDCRGADVYARDSGPLHCHCNTDASNFSISHVFTRILVLPADQSLPSRSRQRSSAQLLCCLTVICRHHIAFSYHIYLDGILPDRYVIVLRQFIYCRFHCKDSLCRAISSDMLRQPL